MKQMFYLGLNKASQSWLYKKPNKTKPKTKQGKNIFKDKIFFKQRVCLLVILKRVENIFNICSVLAVHAGPVLTDGQPGSSMKNSHVPELSRVFWLPFAKGNAFKYQTQIEKKCSDEE